MSETTESANRNIPAERNTFVGRLKSRQVIEFLLLAAIVPVWLGLAVADKWIDLDQFYVIFLVVYTVLLCLLFLVRYVKRTPIVGQVGFLMFVGVPAGTFILYCLFAIFAANAVVLANFLRSFFIILCLLLPGGLYY